ncbi:MAG TPA: serine/threonine-protein kinase [Polyangiaceae bacterium]
MALSAELVQRVQARVGSQLNGKWRLTSVLGIGGMAAVYSAIHRNQNRVAIKMLHPELSIDANVRTRFMREGYVANTVGHPGAVTIFDDDLSEDGAAFLVMELLEGETLDDRATRKGGKLSPGEVLLAVDQLLEVLVAAHARGVVHRDLKPDNLFLTTAGQLKVLDFGIARLREMPRDEDATGMGTFMGTPAFMAPEQARGRWDEVDVRSDVWALGATMFTLLSGRNVQEAETVGEQLILAATAPAPPLATRVPELPAEVCEIVDIALAFRKEDRWPSAESMLGKVREAISLVDAPVSLTAPRPSLQSVKVESEKPTLLDVSEISETGRTSGSSGVARAITGTLDPNRKRRALLAAAVFAAAVALVLVFRQSRAQPAAPLVFSGGLLVRQAAEHAASLVPRSPEPVVDRDLAVPTDAGTPTKTRKPRVRATRKTPPAGLDRKSLRPKVPVVPDENPFDRRY